MQAKLMGNPESKLSIKTLKAEPSRKFRQLPFEGLWLFNSLTVFSIGRLDAILCKPEENEQFLNPGAVFFGNFPIKVSLHQPGVTKHPFPSV